MKKLMIAFAAVAMAACAQAAATKWTSGTASAGFLGPNEESLKNSTAYTMVATLYSDAGITKISENSCSTANAGGSYSATFDSLEKSTTYYIKAVISNAEWTRETELVAFTTAAVDNPSTVNFLSGSGFATSGNKWGEWTAVPEPTSGLLLLLGMAGLALKRKRA